MIGREVIRGWMTRKDVYSNGSPFMDKGKLRAFLKDHLLKELENCSA
jgi:hypothetical protein